MSAGGGGAGRAGGASVGESVSSCDAWSQIVARQRWMARDSLSFDRSALSRPSSDPQPTAAAEHHVRARRRGAPRYVSWFQPPWPRCERCSPSFFKLRPPRARLSAPSVAFLLCATIEFVRAATPRVSAAHCVSGRGHSSALFPSLRSAARSLVEATHEGHCS